MHIFFFLIYKVWAITYRNRNNKTNYPSPQLLQLRLCAFTDKKKENYKPYIISWKSVAIKPFSRTDLRWEASATSSALSDQSSRWKLGCQWSRLPSTVQQLHAKARTHHLHSAGQAVLVSAVAEAPARTHLSAEEDCRYQTLFHHPSLSKCYSHVHCPATRTGPGPVAWRAPDAASWREGGRWGGRCLHPCLPEAATLRHYAQPLLVGLWGDEDWDWDFQTGLPELSGGSSSSCTSLAMVATSPGHHSSLKRPGTTPGWAWKWRARTSTMAGHWHSSGRAQGWPRTRSRQWGDTGTAKATLLSPTVPPPQV